MASSVSSSSRAAVDALLTEHFRYTPLSLIDDIINTVNAIVYRALGAVETGLLSTPPAVLGYAADPAPSAKPPSTSNEEEVARGQEQQTPREAEEVARTEIENGVHQLETLLENAVDKKFDVFELYALTHILNVPDGLEDWIVLGHYENIQNPLPPSAPTPASVHSLRQTLQASQSLSLTLEHEAAQTSTLLSQLRNVLAPNSDPRSTSTPSASLSFLTRSSQKYSPKITPTAEFTTSQLPHLQSLLSTLRSKLSALPALSLADVSTTASMDLKPEEGIDWESSAPGAPERAKARRQRKEYVDGVARRVVRDVVGVRTEVGGEDGEGLRGIKGRGEEEVRGLEGIVGKGIEDDEEDRGGGEEMDVD